MCMCMYVMLNSCVCHLNAFFACIVLVFDPELIFSLLREEQIPLEKIEQLNSQLNLFILSRIISYAFKCVLSISVMKIFVNKLS